MFGCGAMGSIILRNLISLKNTKSVTVIERHIENMDLFKGNEKIVHHVSTESLMQDHFDVAILAVKPQDFKLISLPKVDTIASVMAGVSSIELESYFLQPNIVRIMPNTPAQLGYGMTGLFAQSSVDTVRRQNIENIFNQMGKTMWLQSDDDIDRFTAIAGSGPAYVYSFIRDYINAAEALNIKNVKPLVLQVLLGALEVVKENDSKDIQELIGTVNSKGGTTEAALEVLSRKDVSSIWKEALDAAYKRALELSRPQ